MQKKYKVIVITHAFRANRGNVLICFSVYLCSINCCCSSSSYLRVICVLFSRKINEETKCEKKLWVQRNRKIFLKLCQSVRLYNTNKDTLRDLYSLDQKNILNLQKRHFFSVFFAASIYIDCMFLTNLQHNQLSNIKKEQLKITRKALPKKVKKK